MNKLITISFLLFFILGFTQDYKLEMSYELLSGSKSYRIKNAKKSIIGFLRYNDSYNEFRYFNTRNELVAKESNPRTFDNVISPFDIKETVKLLGVPSNKVLYTRLWIPEDNQFEVFSEFEEQIGIIRLNESNGFWEFLKNETYSASESYAKIFDIKANPITESNTNKPVINKPILNKPTKNNFPITTTKTTTNSNIRNDSFLLSGVDGRVYIGIDQVNLPLDRNIKGYGITPEYKYEIGFFTKYTNLYFGLQYATQTSNTVYFSSTETLKDEIVALGFGFGLIRDKVFIKTGLGYHFYNYPTIESFGNFYDIGEEFYGDIGLKISLINLGGFYILPEVSIDTNGLVSYGLGFAF